MTDAGRTARIKAMSQTAAAPCAITKIGHVALKCRAPKYVGADTGVGVLIKIDRAEDVRGKSISA
jgi:hypothetical protein